MTKKEIIIQAYQNDPNFNRREFERKHSVDGRWIRRIIRNYKEENLQYINNENVHEEVKFDKTSDNSAKLDLKSLTINTLEKALEYANVDLTEWKVDRYTIGSHQVTLKIEKTDSNGNRYSEPKTVTMYKVQVWLKQLNNIVWIRALKELIKTVPEIKRSPTTKHKKSDEHLLEVSLMDVHFGMLSWGKETISDYNIKIAEDLYLSAIEEILDKTKHYPIDKILFPFGNDFLHTDDQTNLTPKGKNILDVDTRLIKIYTTAKKAVIKAIDRCQEVAPVHVLWVPGNHDPNISYYLCDVISEMYRNNENVTVDISPKWRKFFLWGQSLICFTHGSEEPIKDLPMIIATERPDLWGKSIYREVHIGHKHKKHEIKFINVNTHHGCIVRMIPSIAAIDSWHYRKGFLRGWQAAESYLWNKKGIVAQFTHFVDQKK